MKRVALLTLVVEVSSVCGFPESARGLVVVGGKLAVEDRGPLAGLSGFEVLGKVLDVDGVWVSETSADDATTVALLAEAEERLVEAAAQLAELTLDRDVWREKARAAYKREARANLERGKP